MVDAGRVERTLTWINREHGRRYGPVRPLSGGFQGGAWLVLDPDHGPAVFKITDEPAWADRVERAAPLVAEARAGGWPTPAWLITGRTGAGAVYVVQSHVVGEVRDSINDDWLDGVLPVIDRQAGLGSPSAPDHAAFDRAVVFAGGAGYSAAVARAGPEGSGLARAAAGLAAPFADVVLPTSDLVHGDLNPGNVLWLGGALAALVDVEALGRGSRLHDLATLIVYAWLWGDRASVARITAHARGTATTGQLEVSVISVLLGVLEFGVRHWCPADLAASCTTATALLRELDR